MNDDVFVFDANVRCDRCGAQAYHRARFGATKDLLLCNHHHREHKDALLGQGWTIVSDASADLLAQTVNV